MRDDQQIYVIGHREKPPNRTPPYVLSSQDREKYKPPIDYCKIGISDSVERRLSMLQGGTPHELELLTTLTADDAREVETLLHRINRYHWDDRGEWFRLSWNMRNSLQALDHLQVENVERVHYNWSDYQFDAGFYVAIHHARRGEIKSYGEKVA